MLYLMLIGGNVCVTVIYYIIYYVIIIIITMICFYHWLYLPLLYVFVCYLCALSVI